MPTCLYLKIVRMPMTDRPTPSKTNASVTNDELLILAATLTLNNGKLHFSICSSGGSEAKHIRQLDEAHIRSVSFENFRTMSGRGCLHRSRPERTRRSFFGDRERIHRGRRIIPCASSVNLEAAYQQNWHCKSARISPSGEQQNEAKIQQA